jgi:hypothetical protein
MVHKPSFPAPDFRGLFAAISLSSGWFTWISQWTLTAADGCYIHAGGDGYAEADIAVA